MKTKSVFSIFSGIGGSTHGAKLAGFEPCGAIERDTRKSVIYRYNVSDKCLVMPVEDVKVSRLDRPTLLLASPPCQNASTIRGITKNRKPLLRHVDADVGTHLVRFLVAWEPQWFVMENIPMYRHEPSYQAITECLTQLGYAWEVFIEDCADYGVPMHRRRLFLLANNTGARIYFPCKHLFQISWWGAIADLWGKERGRPLPDWMAKLIDKAHDRCVLIDSKRNLNKRTGEAYLTKRLSDKPAFCLTRSHRERPGYVIDGDFVSKQVTARMWARMMTYPDTFVLPLSTRQAVSGLGDSVPPYIIEQICDTLEVM